MQCRGIVPLLSLRGKSHDISRVVGGTWSIFSSYRGEGHSILVFLQRCQDSCIVTMDTSGIYTRLLRTKRILLEVRSECEDHFLVDTVILGILTIFKKCQALAKFKAVNFACLSTWQRDVRGLFEMRWRPMAFCRVFTGHSDIVSSCDMNDEHALSLCREIPPSFNSEHLGVHFA